MIKMLPILKLVFEKLPKEMMLMAERLLSLSMKYMIDQMSMAGLTILLSQEDN